MHVGLEADSRLSNGRGGRSIYSRLDNGKRGRKSVFQSADAVAGFTRGHTERLFAKKD